MLEMNDNYDYRTKHWPFTGVIPDLDSRGKQMRYELRCLRLENESLKTRVAGQQLVITDQDRYIAELKATIAELEDKCSAAYTFHQEQVTARDYEIAKLSRDNKTWKEAALRRMNDALRGVEP